MALTSENIYLVSVNVEGPYGNPRKVSDLKKKEWFFFMLALISFLATLGLTIDRLVEEPKDEPIITVEVVILLSIFASLVFLLIGVIKERPYEVFVYVVTSLTIMVYCATPYGQMFDYKDWKTLTIRTLRLAVVVIGVFNAILGLCIGCRYKTNQNCLFRKAGPDSDEKDFYDWKFRTQSLLEINLLFELSLVVLVLNDGFHSLMVYHWLVLTLGSAYALVWCLLGFLAMKLSSKKLVYFVLVIGVLGPAYIIGLLIYMASKWQNPPTSAITIIASFIGAIIKITACACLFKVSRRFEYRMIAGRNDPVQARPLHPSQQVCQTFI